MLSIVEDRRMFAVVETGGKQFCVEPGQTIRVERLPYEVGDLVALERVLAVGGEGKSAVGRPLVEGAKVIAQVIEQSRTRKIIVFKYHNKERLRRKRGHRQYYTRLRVERIEV
jgi:large subunit ribosomal protein L21